MRSVSPTCGLIWSVIACPHAAAGGDRPARPANRAAQLRRASTIRIRTGRRPAPIGSPAALRRGAACAATTGRSCARKNFRTSAGRSRSVAFRARMTSSSSRMPDGVLHPAERDRRIERAQAAQHGRVEIDVDRLRILLGAVAAAHDGGPRKAHEDRLREVRMPHHQLPLLQRRELGLHRRTQHRVPGRRQLVAVHASVERRSRVPDDAAVHLRAELLRAEQHEPEIPAALREVEQHFANVGVLSVVRRILVQLVDEHDDVVDAEVALLEMFPKLGDDAREDQILRVLLEGRDVDHIHRAILESSRTGGRSRRRRRSPGRRSASRCSTGGSAPCGSSRRGASASPRRSSPPARASTSRNHASRSANERTEIAFVPEQRIAEVAVDDALANEVDQRIGLRVDVVLVEQHLGVLQHLAQSPRERRHVVQQRLVRAQRVERERRPTCTARSTARSRTARGATPHFSYSARSASSICTGLIEEAEVRSLHVEAHRRDRSLLLREVREDRLTGSTRSRSSSSRDPTRR